MDCGCFSRRTLYESCCSIGDKTESIRSLNSVDSCAASAAAPAESRHRSVRLNELRNVYHASELPRTEAEGAECWYTMADIEQFSERSNKAAMQVFGCKKAPSHFLARLRGCNKQEKERELFAACERCKRALGVLYKECNNIRSEQDFESGRVTEGALGARILLQQSYREIEDLVGLEVFILIGIRGDSIQQVRYMLNTVKERSRGDPVERDHLMQLMSQ